MPWVEKTMMDQKMEMMLLWESGTISIVELAKRFNVSRPTVYKWIARYKEKGYVGLTEDSRNPKYRKNRTPPHIEKEIVRQRDKHRRWRAKKLLILVQAKYPNEKMPSEQTIYQILKRNNLVNPRKRRNRLEPQNPVFDPKEPNEIWSADFKGKFRMGNKIYCYPLTIADSYTRHVFCAKGLYSANLENTMKVFADVFKRYGLPKQIHTDNGQPFASSRALGRLSQLSVWFMELGIEPVFSDPARPDQNGRHERMHRELKGEATRPPGHNMQSQQRKLNAFVKEYNEVRPHESLGMRPPAAVHVLSERKYKKRVKPWVYPKECIERYVCRNGAVRIGKREWLMVSKALSEKIVGFEPVGGKLYKLYFRQFFLGYADLDKLKVYDKMKYNRERKL